MTTHNDDLTLVGTAEFKADAHARYAALRAQGPIHRVRSADGTTSWLVVDYELGRETLAHPQLSKNPEPFAEQLRASGRHILLAGSGFGGNMLMADPPEHTRLRRLVSKAFTPAAIERLAPRVEQLAHELIDAIAPAGTADLVAAFTGPLPMAVICDLLGVPEQHRDNLQRWTRRGMGNPSTAQREALLALNTYLQELLDAKRAAHADDLLSHLIGVHDDDHGRLSTTELLGTAVILVVAGHETTVNLLGNAIAALLDHPAQAAHLRANPHDLPGAVEEFLRFDSPVELTPARFATEDLLLGGHRIRRGETVTVALTSASRAAGPAETADRLDVTRPDARHLAFGHGIHYCLGAPLARLEGAVALRVLLNRLPDLAWADPPAQRHWLPAGITRGPVTLPVRFTPAGVTALR
ncbi:cytochrome P450 [Nonomuraea maheshkhaliensis]|uniref:Cytochrome P450 n=1 Tax=Nonomuraea maheshkhaliensis TaxID=419590 RepID=A0ABN2F1U0_9ACTN